VPNEKKHQSSFVLVSTRLISLNYDKSKEVIFLTSTTCLPVTTRRCLDVVCNVLCRRMGVTIVVHGTVVGIAPTDHHINIPLASRTHTKGRSWWIYDFKCDLPLISSLKYVDVCLMVARSLSCSSDKTIKKKHVPCWEYKYTPAT